MIEEHDCMLSTVDNPFNPFEDFSSWLQYDKANDHHCCERLDRIAQIFEDMSELEKDMEYERAIDEIIQYDPLGIYCKVTPDTVFPLH